MTKWYVKDLSKLTNISVQTLHYYDHIALLKPSLRMTNGYRIYSEKDLLKLQQIIALKFFGFELAQIQTILTAQVEAFEHFTMQAEFLQQKTKALLETSQMLNAIISESSHNKSVPWENIIKLIEVYQMTQQLEKTWAGKVFNPEELKQYANFEAGLKNSISVEDKKTFEQSWAKLVGQIATHLDQDPKSEFGTDIAMQVMQLINGLYGKEHANLRHSIWQQGYKKGQMDGDHFIDPEIVEWLDKATDHYYRERIYNLLGQVKQNIPDDLSAQWNALMEEMFGNSQSLKQQVIEEAMLDIQVSDMARKWLAQFSS